MGQFLENMGFRDLQNHHHHLKAQQHGKLLCSSRLPLGVTQVRLSLIRCQQSPVLGIVSLYLKSS